MSGLPLAQQFIPGGVFGLSVDAADMDNDGKAEVLVGRCEAKINKDRGRAHLFRGSWIANQLSTTTGGLECAEGRALVITPPPTTNKNVGVWNAYQTLVDPTDSTPTAFGATVFMLRGDAGTPGASGFDGKPDIAIFSNNAKPSPVLPETGALTIFFNKSGLVSDPCSDGALVCNNGVKLIAPGIPQPNTRFGFQAKMITWAATVNGSPTTADFLLVSEPQWKDTDSTPSRANAGRVLMFPLPISTSAAGGNLIPSHTLKDETGTQVDGLFGHGLDVGNYDVLYAGQELVVSSRNKDVHWPLVTGPNYPGAGQAYTYRSGP